MKPNRLIGFTLAAMLATSASAAPPLKPGFFAVHGSEPFLLHRQVDPAQLRKFRVWDTHLATWRAMESADFPAERAPVMILHLWADWCAPCREELPALRDLMSDLEKTYGGRAQVVLLSETNSPEAMRVFIEQQRGRMPQGPHYLDTGESIATALGQDLPTSLSYPVTLVLDSQRIVRHAIVGSLQGRRRELLAALSRLLDIAGSKAPNPIH